MRAASRTLVGLLVVLTAALIAPRVGAIDLDVEATTSGGSTSNLFSDSTQKKDTYSTSSIDLKYYPFSFARLNLVGEYNYYGNFFNLSNLVYGGGVTIIPTGESSRFSAYLDANSKKREFRDTEGDSTSLNANEITGDEYNGTLGLGYRLNSSTQLRTACSFTSSQYSVDGVIDREKVNVMAGVNMTLFGALAIDLEGGYSTGRYQKINPFKFVKGDPEWGIPDTTVARGVINSGEQYSILLTDWLKSFYISPRISRTLGAKSGLALTYSYRKFMDRDEDAIIYGYSTGYVSPWLNEFAGQAVVVKLKTYLIPRLITTLSAGYWEREHLSTVEKERRPNPPFGYKESVNLLYAQERTDWRHRVDFKIQWPMQLGGGATIEPSVQAEYTVNHSSVLVYDYDDFALNGGVTVRF